MSLYPVAPSAGDGFARDGLMVAFRLEDVASPLRDGRRGHPAARRRWSSGARSGSGLAR